MCDFHLSYNAEHHLLDKGKSLRKDDYSEYNSFAQKTMYENFTCYCNLSMAYTRVLLDLSEIGNILITLTLKGLEWMKTLLRDK